MTRSDTQRVGSEPRTAGDDGVNVEPADSDRFARDTHPSPGGAIRLAACAVAIALLWLIVLPRLATQPAAKRHLDRLDSKGVDASALFYTDLPMMDGVLERIER